MPPPPSHPHTGTTIQFIGSANTSAYQGLLRSLTYTNLAAEPLPGNRTITISVSDGLQEDMTAVIVIVVPSNDNLISIEVVMPMVQYTEGDLSIRVGDLSGLTLSDGDLDAVVTTMSFTLSGISDSESEFLVVDTTAIGGNGLVNGESVLLDQTSSLSNYQVLQN